jgi:hypothetical protein
LALNSSAVAAVVFKSNSDADSEVPGVNSMSGRQLRSNKNVRLLSGLASTPRQRQLRDFPRPAESPPLAVSASAVIPDLEDIADGPSSPPRAAHSSAVLPGFSMARPCFTDCLKEELRAGRSGSIDSIGSIFDGPLFDPQGFEGSSVGSSSAGSVSEVASLTPSSDSSSVVLPFAAAAGVVTMELSVSYNPVAQVGVLELLGK